MSKKLIAVASAAALALSVLVGVAPANANFATPTITDAGTGTGLVSTSPLLSGPNVLNTIVNAGDGDGQATNTAVRFAYTGLVNTAVISLATTSPAIKFLPRNTAGALTGETINAGSGAQTLDVAVAGGAATFFVYSTSTTAASFTASYQGNTFVYWIRAVQGAPYDISVKFPTSLGASQTANIDVTVRDRAGNVIKGTSNNVGFTADTANSGGLTLTTAVVGAATAVTSATSYTWSVTRDAWVGQISASSTGGSAALTVTLNATSLASVGFAAPVATAFGSIVAQDLTGLTNQITALTAQVAALTADYNALVKRWNKRVESRTAPKKKAALK